MSINQVQLKVSSMLQSHRGYLSGPIFSNLRPHSFPIQSSPAQFSSHYVRLKITLLLFSVYRRYQMAWMAMRVSLDRIHQLFNVIKLFWRKYRFPGLVVMEKTDVQEVESLSPRIEYYGECSLVKLSLIVQSYIWPQSCKDIFMLRTF